MTALATRSGEYGFGKPGLPQFLCDARQLGHRFSPREKGWHVWLAVIGALAIIRVLRMKRKGDAQYERVDTASPLRSWPSWRTI